LWDWEIAWQKEEDTASVSLAIGLPQTQIVFEDIAVELLTVLRLKFRNTSDRIIKQPRLSVELDEGIRILGCDVYFEPEQVDVGRGEEARFRSKDSTDNVGREIVDPNQVTVSVDAMYPHRACQEALVVDVFCAGEAGDPQVSGRGDFQDGSVWTTKFQPWKEERRQSLHRIKILGDAGAIVLSIATLGYMVWVIWRSPFGSLQDTGNLSKLVAHPFALALVVGYTLLGALFVWMLCRGWYVAFRLPFAKLAFLIRLVRLSDD
jgi:hypothetical protein